MPKLPTPSPQKDNGEAEAPEKLRPYLFHGIELDWKHGGEDLYTECPWCGRAGKFAVNRMTGQWRCFVCAEGTEKGGGNIFTFVRKLHAVSLERTSSTDYAELAHDRKLEPDTLAKWGVVKSAINGNWLVPGYRPHDRQLMSLYRYVPIKDSQGVYKRRLLPTPSVGHHLFGGHLYDPSKSTVYICEGPWDGMALYELLGKAKYSAQTGVTRTGNEKLSLLATSNVFATPGCQVWMDSWMPVVANNRVAILFDNDYPRYNERLKKETVPAGYAAMRRLVTRLFSTANPPSEIHYLAWGDEGYTKEFPDGCDVRDFINA